MLRHFLWAAFLLLIHSNSFADPGLMQDIGARAGAVVASSGRFNQEKVIGVLPLPLLSSGTYSYSRNSGVIWQTLEPLPSRIHLTREGVYSDDQLEPIQGSNHFAALMLSIFTGDFDQARSQFDITFDGGVDNWRIHMVPRQPALAAHIQSVELVGTATTDQVMLLEANGDTTTITLVAEQIEVAD